MYKQVAFIAIVFLFISSGSSAQERGSLVIPDNVMAAFLERFSDTSNVNWEHVSNIFRVEFLQLGDPFIADFDTSGHWISSKETIMRRQVDDDLIDAVEEAYPGFDLTRFFMNRTATEDEFVVFELKNGNSTIFVRKFAGGFLEVK